MSYVNLDNLTEKEVVKGFKGKFVHSENITIVHWSVDSGSLLPLHKHVHEQIVNLIEGELEFTMNGETKIIKPGTNVIIPSNVEHSGKALTDCYIIDVFYPVREDYK
ncbi:MAG: cupin domain-containing protein [Candidatus Heimdallarchaeota archaeon]|nr:cupin domain-containing protein [Candidatus Heimdallarchaeota archaeon]